MRVQEFSRKQGVSSFSFGYSGIFQTPEVSHSSTLKQSCVKHLGIQEEPCTHVIPLMHGWALFKTYQSYKNICDSVISVCLSHELFSARIFRAEACLLIPYLYSTHWLWAEASKGAYLYLCQGISLTLLVQSLSAAEWLFTQLYLFSFKGYLFLFKDHVLVVFFFLQMVPRN